MSDLKVAKNKPLTEVLRNVSNFLKQVVHCADQEKFTSGISAHSSQRFFHSHLGHSHMTQRISRLTEAVSTDRPSDCLSEHS